MTGMGVPASPSGSRPADGANSTVVSTADAASIPNAWLNAQIEGVIETIAGEEIYEWRRYWSGYLVALQSVQRKASAIPQGDAQ